MIVAGRDGLEIETPMREGRDRWWSDVVFQVPVNGDCLQYIAVLQFNVPRIIVLQRHV